MRRKDLRCITIVSNGIRIDKRNIRHTNDNIENCCTDILLICIFLQRRIKRKIMVRYFVSDFMQLNTIQTAQNDREWVFIDWVRKCIEMKYKIENKSNCNLTTFRYNADGKWTNDEKREECVRGCEKGACINEW